MLAVLLAQAGILGPFTGIEGRFGFGRTFAGTDDLARIAQEMGEHLEIDRTSVKLYPCCKLFHAVIEAVQACRERLPFNGADVEYLQPLGPSAMLESHMNRRPQTITCAQISLPFVTTLAVQADPTNPVSFEKPIRQRTDVLALAERVKPVVDPEFQREWPRRCAGDIIIHFSDGSQICERVLDPKSSPDRPIANRDIANKFRAPVQPAMS